MHYQRRRKTGTTLPPTKLTLSERLWSRVDISGREDCWLWRGAQSVGYGRISAEGRLLLSHRVAWELSVGKIPVGACVLHRCDNPPCCNPAHLFIGTKGDNARDKWAKGRGYSLFAERPEEVVRGEANFNAKLTESQVHEIRRMAAAGERHLVASRRFGITRQNVGSIVSRQTWRHL